MGAFFTFSVMYTTVEQDILKRKKVSYLQTYIWYCTQQSRDTLITGIVIFIARNCIESKNISAPQR